MSTAALALLLCALGSADAGSADADQPGADAAVAVTPVEKAPEPPLLVSLRSRAEGDLAGAVKLLGDSSRQACGGLLEPWCLYYRADAHFYLGDFEAAARDFHAAGALDPRGPVKLRADAREAESLLEAGHFAESLPRFKEALAATPRPELRVLYGDALDSTGDSKAALAEWKKIWLESPDQPASRGAFARLKARGAVETFTPSDWMARTTRLLNIGMPQGALSSGRRALKEAKTPGEKFRATLLLAKVRASRRELAESARLFTDCTSPAAPRDVQAEALTNLGRLRFRNDEVKQAVALFDKVAQDYASEGSADEASFLGAWAFFNSGDFKICAERFAQLLVDKPDGKHADEAVWYRGMCLYRMHQFKEARESFEQLEKVSQKLLPQSLYWKARSSAVAEQEALYRRIARSWPTTWYAFLSQARLAELKLAPEPWTLRASLPLEVEAKTERERRAVLLSTLGLSRDAESELEAASRGPLSPEDAERLAQISSRLGFHGRAYQVANARLWASAFSRGSAIALGMLYPQAYPAEVKGAAEAVGIDPYFVWSIMRRESSFNPLARSAARAHGLMQLIGPTARKIAALTGEPRPGVAELQRPAKSLPIATWYLAELVGRFHHAALAAAAYNGGPSSVAKWVDRRGSEPLDEFVEMIPFKETRGYVRNVLGDYLTYRAIYGAAEPALPFTLAIPRPEDGAAF